MTMTLYRGIPGSGKTTRLMNETHGETFHASADMFFRRDGAYQYDASYIGLAHRMCRTLIEHVMQFYKCDVCVDNTFVHKWEIEQYIKLAERHGYTVRIVECDGNYGSTHNVPKYVVERMKKEWEEV